MAKRGRPMKLSTWVRRQIDGGATMLVLFRGKRSVTGGEVVPSLKLETYRIEKATEAEGLSDTIEEMAGSDAANLHTLTPYLVRSNSGDVTLGSFTIEAGPSEESEESENDGLREPATPTGLLAQLMRHTENQARQNHALTMTIMEQARDYHRSFDNILGQLSKLASEGLEAKSRLATGEDERELKRAELEIQATKIEQNQMLIREAVGLAKKAIPALALIESMPSDEPAEPAEPAEKG